MPQRLAADALWREIFHLVPIIIPVADLFQQRHVALVGKQFHGFRQVVLGNFGCFLNHLRRYLLRKYMINFA